VDRCAGGRKNPRKRGQGRTARTVMGRRQAVTVVELAIWLAIMGTLCVIASGMFAGMRDEFRVRRAVREMAALLEWVRWEAVRGGVALRVTFDTEEGRVDVVRASGDTEEGADAEPEVVRRLDLRADHPGIRFGAAEQTPRTSGCNLVDPGGVHLTDHAIEFYPTGTSDRSGSIYLIPENDLPDRRDRMAALSVLLTTGRVQLWRYDTWAESPCSAWGGWVPLY